MGIQDVINKGVAGASRTTKTMQLKAEVRELGKKRTDMMAQLGDGLYEEVRTTPRLREPREALIASIEALDARVEALKRDINQIEHDAMSATQVVGGVACPVCNKLVDGSSKFCVSCGTNLEEYRAAHPQASGGTFCQSCGAALAQGAKFCISCGALISADSGAVVPVAQTGAAPVASGAAAPVAQTGAVTPVTAIPVGTAPVGTAPVAPVGNADIDDGAPLA